MMKSVKKFFGNAGAESQLSSATYTPPIPANGNNVMPALEPVEYPVPSTVEGMRKRLAEIPQQLADCEHRLEVLSLEQRNASEKVDRYTAAARAGTLDDHSKLANALREQATFDNDAAGVQRAIIDELQEESRALHAAIYNADREAKQQAYNDAVHAYCSAIAALLGLAQKVRDTAHNAGHQLTAGNSPGLIGREVTINGVPQELSVYAN
jgi:chromosome segregation ATPase